VKSPTSSGTALRFAAFVLALATQLVGCGSPAHFRGPGFDERRGVILEGAGDQLVLAVTHAVVEDGQKNAFHSDLNLVLKDLTRQDGLVGYSLRIDREGDQAWTMSVWRDEAALDAYVDSDAHLAAMRRSRITLRSVDVKRTPWPRGEMPPEWDRVLPLLDKSESRARATARASGPPVRA